MSFQATQNLNVIRRLWTAFNVLLMGSRRNRRGEGLPGRDSDSEFESKEKTSRKQLKAQTDPDSDQDSDSERPARKKRQQVPGRALPGRSARPVRSYKEVSSEDEDGGDDEEESPLKGRSMPCGVIMLHNTFQAE